jgi:hypothetical protein
MANAPLVEIMVAIRDQSMDLGIMADWLGTPPYGTIENTKKYLQSVKRIMSLVQRIYPTSPSNQVVS